MSLAAEALVIEWVPEEPWEGQGLADENIYQAKHIHKASPRDLRALLSSQVRKNFVFKIKFSRLER